MAAATWWVREVADAENADGSLPAREAIEKIRDELSILSVKGHGYGDRNLAMVLTKLDEARLWMTEYDRAHRRVLVVDKAKYVRQLHKTDDSQTATEATVATETGGEPDGV